MEKIHKYSGWLVLLQVVVLVSTVVLVWKGWFSNFWVPSFTLAFSVIIVLLLSNSDDLFEYGTVSDAPFILSIVVWVISCIASIGMFWCTQLHYTTGGSPKPIIATIGGLVVYGFAYYLLIERSEFGWSFVVVLIACILQSFDWLTFCLTLIGSVSMAALTHIVLPVFIGNVIDEQRKINTTKEVVIE